MVSISHIHKHFHFFLEGNNRIGTFSNLRSRSKIRSNLILAQYLQFQPNFCCLKFFILLHLNLNCLTTQNQFPPNRRALGFLLTFSHATVNEKQSNRLTIFHLWHLDQNSIESPHLEYVEDNCNWPLSQLFYSLQLHRVGIITSQVKTALQSCYSV